MIALSSLRDRTEWAEGGRTTKYSYDVGGAFLCSLLRLAGLPGSQYDAVSYKFST